MKILITGATGQLGSLVAECLLKSIPADQLAVSVRNPDKAEALRSRGVDVRHGDFDQPATLDRAFAGIDRLLIISADGDNETRIRQHTNAVEAAQRSGVKFIAYTSLAKATESTNIMAPPHVAAEAAIKKSGIPYSILRNNWYLENESGTIQAVLAGWPWVTSAGEGKVGWALRQDYAEAAAAVLLGEGHENTVYELSGPLLNQDQLASALGQVLGKPVPVQHVTSGAYAAMLKENGMPDFVIGIVVGIQESIRSGSLEVENSDFERVLGRPVTPTIEGLARIVDALRNGGEG